MLELVTYCPVYFTCTHNICQQWFLLSELDLYVDILDKFENDIFKLRLRQNTSNEEFYFSNSIDKLTKNFLRQDIVHILHYITWTNNDITHSLVKYGKQHNKTSRQENDKLLIYIIFKAIMYITQVCVKWKMCIFIYSVAFILEIFI